MECGAAKPLLIHRQMPSRQNEEKHPSRTLVALGKTNLEVYNIPLKGECTVLQSKIFWLHKKDCENILPATVPNQTKDIG